MAWLAIPALIGPIVGPPVGGFITTYRLLALDLPDQRADRPHRHRPGQHPLPARHRTGDAPRRLDWPGFFLAGVAFSGLRLRHFGAEPAGPAGRLRRPALVVGAVGARCLLSGTRRRTAAPLLDLRLFRDPLFRAARSAASSFGSASARCPFCCPLMLQLAFGLSAVRERHGHCCSGRSAPFIAKLVTAPDLRRAGFSRCSSSATVRHGAGAGAQWASSRRRRRSPCHGGACSSPASSSRCSSPASTPSPSPISPTRMHGTGQRHQPSVGQQLEPRLRRGARRRGARSAAPGSGDAIAARRFPHRLLA